MNGMQMMVEGKGFLLILMMMMMMMMMMLILSLILKNAHPSPRRFREVFQVTLQTPHWFTQVYTWDPFRHWEVS